MSENTKIRKTGKVQMRDAIDAFLWTHSSLTGGTSDEVKRQVPHGIKSLEKLALTVAELFDNAGKLVLEDSHLCEYVNRVIPSKLARYVERLPQALDFIAMKEAEKMEASPSPDNLISFPVKALPAPSSPAIPSPLEITDALALLAKVPPEILAQFLPQKN